jgi:hypothetical protein
MKKITIEFYNVLFPYMEDGSIPEKKIVELYYDENSTVQELLDKSEECCADLSRYYDLSASLCYNNSFFPYIITTSDKILFDKPYCETRIVDFLHTHKIVDGIVYADTGIPQARGPDIKDIYDMWMQIYPIIDQIGTMLGLFLGGKEFFKWIKSIFKKKPLPPQTVFDLLLSRDQWNHTELSDELDISVEDVKKLLQIAEFKWDKNKMLYVFSGDSEKIRDKLSKISIFKDE